LLLLLFTDVTKSWDWCLYEAGLFTQLEGDDNRRVVCISGTEKVPNPLRHLQPVRAIPDEVRNFLIRLFETPAYTRNREPITPNLSRNLPEVVDNAATKIANLVAREFSQEPTYCNNHLFIHVKNPSSIRPDRMPDDADVYANGESLMMFKMAPTDWTWGDIRERIEQAEDLRWTGELAKAAYDASRGDIPDAIQATFRSLNDHRVYRPTLYRVDHLADGSIEFKVLFVEDVSFQISDVPRNLRHLITSISMGVRFRFEVLGKYAGRLDDDFDLICQRLEHAIDYVIQESKSRGLMNKSELISVFSQVDQPKIRAMYEQWESDIFPGIFDSLQQRDRTRVGQYLDALEKVNREYLEIATKRFHELMTEVPNVPSANGI
jgi:hypothetical protein